MRQLFLLSPFSFNPALRSFPPFLPVLSTATVSLCPPNLSFMRQTYLPLSLLALSAAAQEKYNVVYIMTDDHTAQMMSCYDNRYVETPNLDRIANDGVRFINSFVANSLSGPSRACMLTGKHSHANGFTDNNVNTVFDGSQQTFPTLLQAQGYETAVIGKWHLTSEPTGFNHWDILIGQGDYYNPTFIRNGEKVQREGYATNVTTDLALDWLENGRDASKPFCLLLHHKAPHRTWMPDTCDLELFADSNFPLPETFFDNYDTRQAAQIQKMSISKDMDIVYDLKMADKDSTIHSRPDLEAWGRRTVSYTHLTLPTILLV